MVAKQEEEPVVKEKVVPWEEPSTIDMLQDRYIVEGKFSGRTPGTTLFLVHSKRRDGIVDQVTENQRFKLFLVAWFQSSSIPRL